MAAWLAAIALATGQGVAQASNMTARPVASQGILAATRKCLGWRHRLVGWIDHNTSSFKAESSRLLDCMGVIEGASAASSD
jgi:hypothetical protein